MIQEQIDMLIEHIMENKNLIRVDQINKENKGEKNNDSSKVHSEV